MSETTGLSQAETAALRRLIEVNQPELASHYLALSENERAYSNLRESLETASTGPEQFEILLREAQVHAAGNKRERINALIDERFNFVDETREYLLQATSTEAGRRVACRMLSLPEMEVIRNWHILTQAHVENLRPRQLEARFTGQPDNLSELLHVSQEVSGGFAALVEDALAALPAADRALFLRHRQQVEVVQSVVEARPELSGICPSGWPRGSTYENARGVYTDGRALIAESFRLQQTGGNVLTTDGAYVLRHETGHAVDIALGLNLQATNFPIGTETLQPTDRSRRPRRFVELTQRTWQT